MWYVPRVENVPSGKESQDVFVPQTVPRKGTDIRYVDLMGEIIVIIAVCLKESAARMLRYLSSTMDGAKVSNS